MRPVAMLEPVSNALTRTRELLFRPFRFNKWAALAVSGMLLLAGEGGAGFSGNYESSGSSTHGSPSIRHSLHEAHHFLVANFVVIAILAPLVILLALSIFLVVRWLNARGRFMLMEQVVQDSGLVAEPWRNNRALANSFFLFRIVWDFIGFLFLGLLAGGAVLIAWPDLAHWINTDDLRFGWFFGGAILYLFVAMLFTAGLWWFLSSLIFHMTLPAMYIRQLPAWVAFQTVWRECFLAHPGSSLLYFLLFIVIGLIRGFAGLLAVVAFGICTCCIGCLWFIIPVLGLYPIAFLTLPVLVFERAYELHFMSQFGDAYGIAWATSSPGRFPVTLPAAPPPPTEPPPVP